MHPAPLAPAPLPPDSDLLPIEQVTMPTDDVSDLKDVFDAINKLCETMRTSTYEEAEDEDLRAEDDEVIDTVSCSAVNLADMTSTVDVQAVEYLEFVSPSESSARAMEAGHLSAWSDALVSPPDDSDPLPSDTEAAAPASELYYTASSEVSLLSDVEVPERPHDDGPAADMKDERRECVMLGHVAAMRERFESMTRTNTPCPDLARSASPSLDVFRDITPSPDLLG